MSCFAMSHKFCDKLSAYAMRFWWVGDPEFFKIHWLNQDDLCKSKLDGGMGFRDFKSFNIALLAKQGWRLITNPNAYWARMMKAIYFPNSSFLKATRGGRPSWAWASLLQGRELLNKGVGWQIHHGRDVKFWDDAWVPYAPNFRMPLNRPDENDHRRMADFLNQSTKDWDLQQLKESLPIQEAEKVAAIPIAKGRSKDKIIWHHEKKGIYSVKSGYHTEWKSSLNAKPTRPSSSFSPHPVIWKTIWSLKTPPKIKHFWWRASRNLLATRENLFRRKCAPSPLC